MIIVVTTGGEQPQQPTPQQPVPPQLPVPPQALGYLWTGTDGATWDLNDGPVRLATGGMRGLGKPTPTHRRSTAPTIDGATWDGMTTGPRDLFLPIKVKPPLGQFLDVEAAFFAGLDPEGLGWLRVTRPDGQWRQIGCRYEEGAEGEYDSDPLIQGQAKYGLRFTAEDPFWQGEPVTVTFAYHSGSPARYPMRYPYRLAPTESLGQARVTNPGDVDAYPVWRINGPFTGFSAGVGDALVEATMTKAAGEWVEIDMHPTKLTVVDEAGVDLWDAMGEAVFSKIPPGDPVNLTTELVGAGGGASVRLKFTPRFWAAR